MHHAEGLGDDMYKYGKITGLRESGNGVDLLIHTEADVAAVVNEKKIHEVWMQLPDGRELSPLQRRKIYATFRDISAYTGYTPEETKEHMKFYHIQMTGCDYFSLSDCSMDQAREFINTLIEFCLYNGVPISGSMLDRTDDIGTYLKQCMRHRKCAVCGAKGETHHWDAIGMGHDRRMYDDTENRKICLCRMHHTIAHQKGGDAFERDYHVFGIRYVEEDEEHGLQMRTLP